MPDTRLKNIDWIISKRTDGGYAWSQANAAILMDIRDELRRLNAVLHCENFLRIPRVLDAIRKNTTKPKRKKVAK